jgi:hypothetical protein
MVKDVPMYYKITKVNSKKVPEKKNNTYLSFPSIGDRPIITEANADLTC